MNREAGLFSSAPSPLTRSHRDRRAGGPDRERLRIESLEPRLTMAADLANSIGSARVFTSGTTITGSIGDGILGGRDVDIVGFVVPAGGRLTVDLNARSLPGGSTLDGYLRVFNSSGRALAFNDDFDGSQDSYVSYAVPSAGTYFVGVSGFGNSAYNPQQPRNGRAGSVGSYSLIVTVVSPEPVDRAGNTTATARDVGRLEGSLTVRDAIGGTDSADYYRFTVPASSQLDLRLAGMSRDADLVLLDRLGGRVATSMRAGIADDVIQRQLQPGTYYAQVVPYDGATNYSLSFTTRRTPPGFSQPTYSSTTGWGWVDAAAAVAKVRGHAAPFSGVADLGGINRGNDLVNAPEVWAWGITGAGVVVAVVDTGVDYNHPDLRQNIWVNPREIAGDGIDNDRNGFVDDVRGWDFADNDANPMDIVDTRIIDWTGRRGNSGHGTHVAGTIAAARNGIGSTGVAPDARIMPVRVFDQWGNTTESAIARGVRYAADNGAHVINMSLRTAPSRELEQAIRHATGRGCVVVIAAGNSWQPTPSFPADLAATIDGVIAVGAGNENRTLAGFSNRAGDDPRMQYVVAPGVSVHSTLPGNTYGTMNGSSMAAPHVAGVAALMRSSLPAAGQQGRWWPHLTGTARQLAEVTTTGARVTVTPAALQSLTRVATFAALATDESPVAGPRRPSRAAFAALS